MTSDVQLPFAKQILFPAICVVCQKQHPDGVAKLYIHKGKFAVSEAASTLLTGSAYTTQNDLIVFDNIPACNTCAKLLHTQHRRLKSITYISWLLSVVFIFALPGTIGWKIAVFIFFFLLPVIIAVVMPPALDITFSTHSVTLHFALSDVAKAFALANQATVK